MFVPQLFFLLVFFLVVFFRVVFFLPFLGTLAPFFLASDNPIAIACFLLVTFRPLPDLSVPLFLLRIARFTEFCAFFEYFAIDEC